MLVIGFLLVVIATLIFIIIAWLALDPQCNNVSFDRRKLPPRSE